MKKLTLTQCRNITKPGLHRVDDTLYLIVKPSGRKSWVQRLTINGRRTCLGLGPFPVVTLVEAQDAAIDNRRLLRKGVDPLGDRRRERTLTFREATIKTHESLVPTFRSPLHVKNWLQVVEKHAYPVLAELPVDRIRQEDVLKVLTPIWSKRPDTAKRVRQRIRAIIRYCQAHNHVVENVADERIDGALPSMSKVKENFRALPYRETPDAYRTIGSLVSPARTALRFLILTAARSNEVREAIWDEIDFESSTWVITGKRMKGGKEHRVPLSKSALEVLEVAREFEDRSDLVFPSPVKPGRPMTPENLMKVLRTLGLADRATVHGFRTSFRTWASERTDIPREVCEMALAHTVGNAVEQAYSRSDLLEKRTSLMSQWDGFLQGR